MTTSCALAIALSLAAPAAQAARPMDTDLKELSTYTLTLDTLNKVDRATRAMIVELKKDPKFQEMERIEGELEALRKKDEPTEDETKRIETLEARREELKASTDAFNMNSATSISEMADQIQKEPRMAGPLQREGLPPREFAKFMLAMVQAGFAAGMQKAGLLKNTPEGTNPANIKWVLEHEAEIQKLQQAWAPEKKK